MKEKENILNELKELESTLAEVTLFNVYAVPAGYFDGLAAQVLNRIKAMEAETAVEELGYLSPYLMNISREKAGGPYVAPDGFFEGLAENMIHLVRETNEQQTAKEELETISPFLSGLNKKTPYAVPEGYFESIGERKIKPAAKLVSITHRKWFRYAAAAVVTGLIATLGLIYLNPPKPVDPVKQPYAWVKKNINKVDKADIDSFIDLANEELPSQTLVTASPVKPGEINDLMKDVSDQEIQKFLETIPESEITDDALLN